MTDYNKEQLILEKVDELLSMTLGKKDKPVNAQIQCLKEKSIKDHRQNFKK